MESIIVKESLIEEDETSLVTETCGYCSKPKRPEKASPLLDMSPFCRCPNASDSTEPGIRLGAVPSSAFKRSPSPRRSIQDRQIQAEAGKLEIVSIREKHGQFRKAIPNMPVPVAVIFCLINVVLPGIGTFLSAFTVLCGCETEYKEERRRAVTFNLLAALLQLVLAPIIVGWIWSILWGISFVNISVSKAVDDPRDNSML